MISALPPLKTIARYEYPADGGAYTFDGILALVALLPFTGCHLVLDVNGQSNAANNDSTFTVQVNADVGNNYNFERLRGVGAAGTCARSDNQAAWNFAIPGDATANNFGGGQILIVDAFGARSHNGCLGFCGSTEQRVQVSAQRRANSAAVDSLTVLGNTGFKAGTVLTLSVVDERYLLALGYQILTANGSFTFINLPQVPASLCFIGNLRTDEASDASAIRMTVNGDAVDANYAHQAMLGDDAGPPLAFVAGDRRIGAVAGAPSGAGVFGPFVASISQGALPDNDASVLAVSGVHATSPRGVVECESYRRNNQEPIHTVVFDGWTPGRVFVSGSVMWCYIAPKRLLERVTLEAAAASITFDNGGAGLSQGYHDLGVGLYGRTTS